MKFSTKGLMLAVLIAAGAMFFASCKKSSPSKNNSLASTPLYDTLGWFIQGGNGSVQGQGTVMINDPDNNGQKIQAGRLAIRTVVKTALPMIAGNAQLSVYFPTLIGELGNSNTTGFNNLLESFTNFVQSAVSGQTGIYTGRSMLAAHNNASYSRFGDAQHATADSADFDQFVTIVAQAATSLNVPNSVIGQLGALLYTTEGDVVQDK